MDKTPEISIIIPFLNEEDNIGFLSEELSNFVNRQTDIAFEIILVNDGSTDRSVEKISHASFPAHTRLISLSQNFGSHAALRSGVMHAKGKFITFIYADLQDPIDNIVDMYAKAQKGNEIVWGYRQQTQNSWFERKFSGFYSGLMQRYVNVRYPSKGFDVVLFNRKVADSLNKNIESNSSLFLQILNLGFRQDFIEYQKIARKAGKSKWTLSKKIKLLIDSFVAFSYTPIRLVSYVGILFFIVGLFWTTYIIARKLLYNNLESGWPALVSILMIGFGITNISLGVIAEYLWRTLDASRKRPVFIIDEIIELN
jgi:glycosyltransferase involved in cell wall biosynthesis